ALNVEINGAGGLATVVDENVELALFAMLEHLPFGFVTSMIGIMLIFIFFVTSADSATYVLSSMTSHGSLVPSMRVKAVWGLLIAGTASILLISGSGGLDALQTASLIAALPFSIIMLFLILSMIIMFQRDYAKERRLRFATAREEVKEEFRDEFLDEIKDDIQDISPDEEQLANMTTEIKDDFISTAKDSWYDEVKDDVYDNLKEEVY